MDNAENLGDDMTLETMDSLARGIAASGFDLDIADAEATLASVAPDCEQDGLRSRIRSYRLELREETIRRPAPEERVEELRSLFISRGLDGFLVPMADQYQGEFMPACSRRLEWLTGFGGSAGFAIVLKEKAAIFVDGRYTLQVRQQVNRLIFAPHRMSEIKPEQWIQDNAREGARIGYDPWLHTRSGIRTFKQACRRLAISPIPVESNPLDEIWTGRPAEPLGPVVLHGLEYSGEAASEKLRRIVGIVESQGCDAALIPSPDSIAWLLNVRGSDVPNTPLPLGRALVERKAPVSWFVDGRKVGQAVRDRLKGVAVIREPDELPVCIEKLGEAGCQVLVDPGKTPDRLYQVLKRSKARIRKGDDPCVMPKAEKNTVEIGGMRKCHVRDGAALCEFLAWLSREGPKGSVTEMSAAARLYDCRKSDPAFRGTSFDTISGSGPNGAIVHYRVSKETDRRLRPGDVYLVDSGGQYLDGTTDVTRTVYIGGEGADEPAADVKDRYTRVLKGHIAVATARFPVGTRGSQLDSLARLALWEHGLDYDHGTGHGVGSYLGVHEGPQRISKHPDTDDLKPGMVVSNEPGYYKPDAYGIRIENLVVVQAMEKSEGFEQSMLCFETITLAPIDRRLVAASLLSPAERQWLNDYHARVCKSISPLVSAEARTWLESATREV